MEADLPLRGFPPLVRVAVKVTYWWGEGVVVDAERATLVADLTLITNSLLVDAA